MADVKRLHYFNHQFLVEADFTDEQQYHLTMRRRHNEALHTYGVAGGLAVEKTGDKEITVQSGMAIDREGRELVLLDPRVVSVSGSSGSTVTITIAYHEEESDPSTATGVTGNTRIMERPEVQAVTTATPADGSVIRLAQFVLDGAGNVPGNVGDAFTQGRQVAGAMLVDGAVTETKLANSAVTNAKIATNTINENKLDTATQGKLVTNGNSHNHSGGDGAQIKHSTLNLDDGANPHGTTAAQIDIQGGTNKIVEQINAGIGTIAEARLDSTTQGKLVTNGNSHDHFGGDGAQIKHSALNLDDGANPHGTTAADVGALPTTGGIVSGSLQVNDSLGIGVAPRSWNKLWLIANDGAAGTVVTSAGMASNDGSATVSGLDVNAYGTGTGWKHGITSSVSGAGPKQAGYFYAGSEAGSADGTNALYAYASSEGTGTVRGFEVTASGSGKGVKEGIFSVVSGAGSKQAGQFYAYSDAGSSDYTSGLRIYANSEGTGDVLGLQMGSSGSGTGSKQGISCSVSGAGSKQAGSFTASSAAGSSDSTTALYASANSDGTGTVTGLQVSSSGAGTGWKQGITCDAYGAGPKRAGQFTASSAAGSSDFTNGLYTYADSEGSGSAYGLLAYAYGLGTGTKYGVYGYAGGGGTSYAGYFAGNVYVSGTLSKASGTFLIDHPLDPENKTLRHSFVESPEDLCLYRGKAKLDSKGQATVKMPEYFAALTKEDEATISLTPIGSKPFLTSYEWNRGFTAFTLYGEAGREVSYLVLANRDDPVIHQLRHPVEEEKGNGYFEKGQLLNPEAYGKAPETAFAFRGAGPVGVPPAGAEAPVTPTAFASMGEERQRMEETLAKTREEQQQRMEAFRQEEEQRRKRLEETLAAIQPQPDRPSE